MKKHLLILTLFFLSISISFSQKKTCDSEKQDFIDINAITKCTVNLKKKKTSALSVNISVKRRFLKKRANTRKGTSSVELLNSNGISNVRKGQKLKINTKVVSNTLSAEKMKRALIFDEVNQIATFNKCKNVSKKKAIECFNLEMIKHINTHFHYPTEALINKIEGEVWIRFIINIDGKISNIKMIGPENGELLKQEALRVVSNLPNFIPAVHNEEKVPVKYGFPINFSLTE